MLGTSTVSKRSSILDSLSAINFDSGVLPAAQRYDYPIDIKDGLLNKKKKPVYNPNTAAVYSADQEKSEMEQLDDSKMDEPTLKEQSKGLETTKDVDAMRDVISPTKASWICGTAFVSLLVGLISFMTCIVFIAQPLP